MAAVGRLRTLRLKALGGRSPYEVITGMQPTLPATLAGKLPVMSIPVDSYVAQLRQHLDQTYAEVKAAALEKRGEDNARWRKPVGRRVV